MSTILVSFSRHEKSESRQKIPQSHVILYEHLLRLPARIPQKVFLYLSHTQSPKSTKNQKLGVDPLPWVMRFGGGLRNGKYPFFLRLEMNWIASKNRQVGPIFPVPAERNPGHTSNSHFQLSSPLKCHRSSQRPNISIDLLKQPM